MAKKKTKETMGIPKTLGNGNYRTFQKTIGFLGGAKASKKPNFAVAGEP